MRIGSNFSGAMLYDPISIRRSQPSEARKETMRAMNPESNSQNDMAIQERQVLAREQALKASAAGGSTHTIYTYATGPDGKKYIVGAEVSIVAPEEVLDAIPGGNRTSRNAGTRQSTEPAQGDAGNATSSATTEESPEVAAQIAKLQQTEREVIAHEAAHMAAGGQFAGAVSYTYTTGPDGKQYITGGEVPISTPATSDPEEALQNAQQVMRAAMAPGNPSGPDMAVAASAAQTAANARAQIARGEGDDQKQDVSSVPTSTEAISRFENDDERETVDIYKGMVARGAYESTKSTKGLWTESRGFDHANAPTSIDPFGNPTKDEGFRIAA